MSELSNFGAFWILHLGCSTGKGYATIPKSGEVPNLKPSVLKHSGQGALHLPVLVLQKAAHRSQKQGLVLTSLQEREWARARVWKRKKTRGSLLGDRPMLSSKGTVSWGPLETHNICVPLSLSPLPHFLYFLSSVFSLLSSSPSFILLLLPISSFPAPRPSALSPLLSFPYTLSSGQPQ